MFTTCAVLTSRRRCSTFLNYNFLSIKLNIFSMASMCEEKACASRNVEIKARISSEEEFLKKIEIAKSLTSTSGAIIPQKDVFFHTKQGRLKLRYLKDADSQLVYYNRPDQTGPKLSEYYLSATKEPESLEKILSMTNGVIGCVQKERLLFLHKGTRIHLDKVDGLGHFLEFEVVLEKEQTLEEGDVIAKNLMRTFEIDERNLMTGAYMDEILNKDTK